MDPITTAIVAALTAGVLSGLTETSKTALGDAYTRLKELLARKFGASSEVLRAVESLETKPDSQHRQGTLQEEIIAARADQDNELLAAASSLKALAPQQQVGVSKYTIQINGPTEIRSIGDHNSFV